MVRAAKSSVGVFNVRCGAGMGEEEAQTPATALLICSSCCYSMAVPLNFCCCCLSFAFFQGWRKRDKMHIRIYPLNIPESNRYYLTAFCVNSCIMVAWNMILLVLGTCKSYFSYINLPINSMQNPGKGTWQGRKAVLVFNGLPSVS